MPINEFHGHGQLANSPKIIETPKGNIVMNTLMVRRNYKNPKTNNYDFDCIPIIFRGETAKYVAKKLKRLDYIYVLGRLQIVNDKPLIEVREIDLEHGGSAK